MSLYTITFFILFYAEDFQGSWGSGRLHNTGGGRGKAWTFAGVWRINHLYGVMVFLL